MKAFLLISCSCIVLVSGCTSYSVRVNGYSNLPKDESLLTNSTICVIENKKAENFLFEAEIKKKIERLLSEYGYPLANAESADYYLLFSYGISDGKNETISVPIYNPGSNYTVNTYGAYGSSYSTIHGSGYTTYVPHSVTKYYRYLKLHLVEAASYRDKAEIIEVWVGDVVSEGANSDLREVINYLLIPAFEYFGQDTKKGKKIEILEMDKRAKGLMSE